MKKKIPGNHALNGGQIIRRCPVKQKACHATRKTAKTAINISKSTEPLYVYKCEHCHYFHLTRRNQTKEISHADLQKNATRIQEIR